jgi:4'-phosphopantetheinyl transferase
VEDEGSRAAHFVKLWTLKEAYVKALGSGINAQPGLQGFSFRIDDGGNTGGTGDGGGDGDEVAGAIAFSTQVTDGKRWEFLLLKPTPLHVAALCAEVSASAGQPLRVKSFDGEAERWGNPVAGASLQITARGASS